MREYKIVEHAQELERELQMLARERDEARAQLEALKTGEHLLFSQRMLGPVMQERDWAMARLAKLQMQLHGVKPHGAEEGK
jgi:hypothetical protein